MFKPGHEKRGGRKKGTPNKKTQDLMAMCEARGINLFEAFLEIIEDVNADPNLRFSALKEAAQYVYPKRKAIEHSVDPQKMDAMEEFEKLPKEEQIKQLEGAIERLKGA